ncbi:3-keto-disaccharide hydrolase [Fibrella arboris]|uniref:3-keto-disaccharide hydrolase n=1 Tax=Fibrella arboris TaxID=3242486 RepID=UPI003521F900
MKNLLLVSLVCVLIGCSTAYSQHKSEKGWVSIFDGKTLSGWKAAENPGTFSVDDGAIVVAGPRAHLFYEGPVNDHNFRNFEWKALVKTTPGSNSGMFIHTAYQETGWPSQGYEIQVNQTHTDWRKTGSVYGKQDVKETFVKDDEWYTEQITVKGNQVTVLINGKVINSYTEPESISQGTGTQKLSNGTIALQGHDPKSKVYFKDIQVRVLPD